MHDLVRTNSPLVLLEGSNISSVKSVVQKSTVLRFVYIA